MAASPTRNGLPAARRPAPPAPDGQPSVRPPHAHRRRFFAFGRWRAADENLGGTWLARRYAGASEIWKVRDPKPAGRICYGGLQLSDEPKRFARMTGREVGDGCGGERWRQDLEVIELAGLQEQMGLAGP